jgi:prepilin-type N-terminal cleavage/methylation domain-containing protein
MARDGGFSLIEMMIVLTIAALVMAAFPIARGYLPQAHVNAATRGLAQTLRDARGLAIKYGYDIIVKIDTEHHQINVYGDSDLDGAEDSELMASHTYADYGKEFEFRAVSTTGIDGHGISSSIDLGGTNPPAITFRANGSAVNSGVIYVTSTVDGKVDLGRAIEITSTGWVQTWIFDVNGNPGPWKKWL